MYEKIVTHNDFDGLASAALCSYFYKIEKIQFAGPNTITNSEISITDDDIVCDLPYPLTCGLWFDHHVGNRDELTYRQIDPASIQGRFEPLASCAHVCYNHFSAKTTLPAHFESLVAEADIIDAFDYHSIEDWRKLTPGKIIEGAIKARGNFNIREKYALMRSWIYLLRDKPLEEVAQTDSIQELFEIFQQEEKSALELIEKNASFHPNDPQHEIIILDFTHFKRRPTVIKNLALILYPDALTVLELNSLFKRGIKTTDFGVSMSLSLNLNSKEHSRDVSEIMRELNIGDGHAGAAGGTVRCRSKNEMLKQKDYILNKIVEIWQEQA